MTYDGSVQHGVLKDIFKSYNFIIENFSIRVYGRKLWTYKIVKFITCKFWDSHLGLLRKKFTSM